MADAVASEALGPRPGIAIVSFWQGIVEIVLRAVTAVLAFCAFIATAVAIGESVKDSVRGASGWILAMAIFTITYEILVIVIRFLNFGVVNLKIQIFLIVDIIASAIFLLAFLVGAIALAATANDKVICVSSPASEGVATTTSTTTCSEAHDAAVAGAVFSFLVVLPLGASALWMVLFLVKGWNKEVVEYTLKSAVTK